VLLFFIPLVRPLFAMLLMAGNWFFIKYVFFPPLVLLFWLVPWPAFWPPSLAELGVYYALLALVAWHRETGALLRRLRFRARALARTPQLGRRLVLAGALGVLAGFGALLALLQPHEGPLRLDVLHPYVFGRGGGHPVLIQAPWGEVVLVDGGTDRVRKGRASIPFDIGERVVASVLLGKRIAHVDTAVVTNFRPENLGGLLHVLEHFDVERVVDPFGPTLARDVSYDDFLEKLDDASLNAAKLSNTTREIHATYLAYRELCARRGIHVVQAVPGLELLDPRQAARQWLRYVGLAAAGSLLLASGLWLFVRRRPGRLDGPELALLAALLVLIPALAAHGASGQSPETGLQVLAPRRIVGGPGALEGSSIVLRLHHRQFSALLASDLQEADQQRLLAELGPEALRADVLLVPDGGWPEAWHAPFAEAVRPAAAIAPNHLDRFNRRKVLAVLEEYRNRGATVYLTQDAGAVSIETDGLGELSLSPMRRPSSP
jgi:beta-lactamase superfamily II metal-dependent hydrolase